MNSENKPKIRDPFWAKNKIKSSISRLERLLHSEVEDIEESERKEIEEEVSLLKEELARLEYTPESIIGRQNENVKSSYKNNLKKRPNAATQFEARTKIKNMPFLERKLSRINAFNWVVRIVSVLAIVGGVFVFPYTIQGLMTYISLFGSLVIIALSFHSLEVSVYRKIRKDAEFIRDANHNIEVLESLAGDLDSRHQYHEMSSRTNLCGGNITNDDSDVVSTIKKYCESNAENQHAAS